MLSKKEEPDMIEVNATMKVTVSSEDADLIVEQVMREIIHDAYNYARIDEKYYSKLRRAARIIHNHFCLPDNKITKDAMRAIENADKDMLL